MITLQKIFDAAWQAFIAEEKPPAKINGECRYLTSDGRKCAVGLCIPDGHSAQNSSRTFGYLVELAPSLFDASVRSVGSERLDRFQRELHDNIAGDDGWLLTPDEMRNRYILIAEEYGLTVPQE